MGKILAVCTSRHKGTAKTPQIRANLITDFGIENDAHAGKWHRQVSLLSIKKIKEFNEKGGSAGFGDFGENLVIEGIELKELPVGTRLACGDVVLEITQIGKECHTHCAVYNRTGNCVMPTDGIFARVINGGMIATGDEITIMKSKDMRPWQCAVITLSDKAFRKEREDKSGPVISEKLKEKGFDVAEMILMPDEPEALGNELIRLCDQRQLDLILTTGGTGFGKRDNTPEVTVAVADKNVPGISEAIRAESLKITPRAMLSRAASVIRGRTLIINLPGSPKACAECMDMILDVIPHGLNILRDNVSECAE